MWKNTFLFDFDQLCGINITKLYPQNSNSIIIDQIAIYNDEQWSNFGLQYNIIIANV